MSSYVDSVLAEGERIVYRAAISNWKFFISYLVGAGASLEPLRGIARPLELRKKPGGVAEVAVPKSNP
jgi:hypothetical protein